MSFSFNQGPQYDSDKVGVEVTGFNDAELEASAYDATTREMTDLLHGEVFFCFTDAARTPETMTEDDWGALVEEAAYQFCWPEEPRYGQLIYDSATERRELRKVEPAEYGGNDFKAMIGLRAIKNR